MCDRAPRNHAYHATKNALEFGWRPRSHEDIKRFMLPFPRAKSRRGVLFCLLETGIIDVATAHRLAADPDVVVPGQYCTHFPQNWLNELGSVSNDYARIPEWVPVVRPIGFSYTSR